MQIIEIEPRTLQNGPFSCACSYKDLVFVSGQIAFDPEKGGFVEGDIDLQTRQTLKNLQFVLEASQASLKSVLKLTCFLRNMSDDYAAFNHVFMEFFPGPDFPVRSTVEAGLVRNCLVEIDAIAHRVDHL